MMSNHPDQLSTAPPPLGASEAVALCQSLETSMEVLIELIETECNLIRQGKLNQAKLVQETKAKCAEAYIGAYKQARLQSDALRVHAPQAVDALRRRHDEFKALLQLNMAALMTARAVSENLVRSVAESVGQPARPDTYGSAGTLQADTGYQQGLSVNHSA